MRPLLGSAGSLQVSLEYPLVHWLQSLHFRCKTSLIVNETWGIWLLRTFAASAYCPPWNKVLNFLMKSSSAPARLLRVAIRRARSGFCIAVVIYWIIVSSSTLTDSTLFETANNYTLKTFIKSKAKKKNYLLGLCDLHQ